MKKKFSVIYIGSKSINLKIAQKEKNDMKILEDTTFPINIGIDTFKDQLIDYKNIKTICKILNRFKNLIKDYNILNVKIIATTAIREAKNKDFIKDQVKLKTGFDLDILTDHEEKKLIYQGIEYILQKKNIKRKDYLFTYVGTGKFSLAYSKQNYILDYLNLNFGSIKLNQILSNLKNKTTTFSKEINKYLNSFRHILSEFIKKYKSKNLVLTGKEMNLLREILKISPNEKIFKININEFNSIYKEFTNSALTNLSSKYNLTIHEVEQLLTSLTIYFIILKFSDIKNIYCINYSLEDILLTKKLKIDTFINIEKQFDKSISKIAYNIGQKYNFDNKHATNVKKLALKLFDQTKEIHGLNNRDRLILEVSALLHDIGKFISLQQHYKHSYNILKEINIIGLTNEESRIIAYISKYNSYKEMSLTKKLKIDQKAKIKIFKITALLKVADSLDRSHNQPINNLDIKIKKDNLKILIQTYKDLEFEKWSLNSKSKLFTKIFGIKPIIETRSDFYG